MERKKPTRKALVTGIIISCLITILSIGIAIYLHSMGDVGYTYFFFPIFVGVVTIVFLLNKYFKTEA